MAKQKKIESFVNPFNEGVSYEEFLKSIPNGITLKDYCKSELTKEQIEWLENDINHYKKNKKEKENN